MPVVDHKVAPEVPWRPNHRKWDITHSGDGTTSSSLSYFVVGVGAGAPLHVHQSDELIVVLAGTLEARLGSEIQRAGPDHTVVIPPNVPHGFTSVGPGEARLLVFFPASHPFKHTRYLNGGSAPPGVDSNP